MKKLLLFSLLLSCTHSLEICADNKQQEPATLVAPLETLQLLEKALKNHEQEIRAMVAPDQLEKYEQLLPQYNCNILEFLVCGGFPWLSIIKHVSDSLAFFKSIKKDSFEAKLAYYQSLTPETSLDSQQVSHINLQLKQLLEKIDQKNNEIFEIRKTITTIEQALTNSKKSTTNDYIDALNKTYYHLNDLNSINRALVEGENKALKTIYNRS